MPDVLMIALQFAPIPTTGAYRAVEFAKRLPAHGITPTVLTIAPKQAEIIFGAKSKDSMLGGLPEAVQVSYVETAQKIGPETPLQALWRMLTSFNDGFHDRFIQSMMAQVRTLARDRRFAAVYVTAPPFGASALGLAAARELGVPCLVDMRDAWAEWAPAPQLSRLHYRRKQQDERRIFARADRVITVTEELAELFRRSHPYLPADHFGVIPNGIEDTGQLEPTVTWQPEGDTIDVGYVGSFYYVPPKSASLRSPHRYLQYDPGTEDWSYRSPLHFFRAWQALDRRDPEVAHRLRFHLVGPVPDWLPGMAEGHGIADLCVFHGAKPRDEIPGFLDSMDALLATSMKRLDGDDYCLASKSFEYIAARRPIFAFVCRGSQKRFFEGSGGAILFDPDDPEAAAETLAELGRGPRPLPVHKAFVDRYLLDHTAAEMARELYALSGRNRASTGSAA